MCMCVCVCVCVYVSVCLENIVTRAVSANMEQDNK